MPALSGESRPAKELVFKGFTVTAEIRDSNGVWFKANVFKVESPHAKKITCYIASKAGLQYRVTCMKHDCYPEQNFLLAYFADGGKLKTTVITSDERPGRIHTCHGRAGSDFGVLHLMKFAKVVIRNKPVYKSVLSPAKLSLTDDEGLACSNEQIIKNIGVIYLRLHRVHILGESRLMTAEDVPQAAAISPAPVLHEQNKLTQLEHGTIFGQGVEAPPRTICDTLSIDPDDNPFLCFEFRYRSRQILEAQKIVPQISTTATLPRQEASSAREGTSAILPANKHLPAAKTDSEEKEEAIEEPEVVRLRREVSELREALMKVNIQDAKGGVDGAEEDLKPDIKPKLRAAGDAQARQPLASIRQEKKVFREMKIKLEDGGK